MKVQLILAGALALAACGAPSGNGQETTPPANVQAPTGPAVPDQPAAPAFGPEQRMTGEYTAAFERSEFDNCWLSFTPEAAAELNRAFPPEDQESPRHGRSYQLEIVGRRTLPNPDGPDSYGHMGGWRCEIQAVRIVSARRSGPK